MDSLSADQRRKCMSAVRRKDTKPEIFLRSRLHRLGYRYRIDVGGLPGRPDIVFPSRKAVIFVNGCFWHRHGCRRGRSSPKVRAGFWSRKFAENRERDRRNRLLLRRLGWRVLTVWECQLLREATIKMVIAFLERHSVSKRTS